MSRLWTLVRVAALIVAVLACMATSPPRYRFVRSYPTWNIERPPAPGLGCARLEVWVSKTGKTGVGISVLARSSQPSCEVAIESLAIGLGARNLAAPALPPAANATAERAVHFYTPVPFDNQDAWNRGDRTGVLHLRLRAGSERVQWSLAIHHIRRGNHDRIPWHSPEITARPDTGEIITVTPPSGPIEVVP